MSLCTIEQEKAALTKAIELIDEGERACREVIDESPSSFSNRMRESVELICTRLIEMADKKREILKDLQNEQERINER